MLKGQSKYFRLKSNAYLEGLILSVTMMLIALYIHPQDPLFYNKDFPWLWLVSSILALSYGISAVIGAIFVIWLAVVYFRYTLLLYDHHFQLFILGGAVLVLVCGQFSSIWRGKIKRTQAEYKHALQRLEMLTRQYYFLRTSHLNLEQSIIHKPVTLRSSLLELRQLLLEARGALTPAIVDRFLKLIAHACSLEQAAIYLYSSKARQKNHYLQLQPAANVNMNEALILNDVLVQHCLSDLQDCCYTINEIRDHKLSEYVLVVPLLSSDHELLGIVAVKNMRFLALNQENLQILSVLAGYFADEAWAANRAQTILASYPDCPLRFAVELVKIFQLRQRFNVSSALVVVSVQKPVEQAWIDYLQKMQRSLDMQWLIEEPERIVLLVLMPLAKAVNVEGYVQRVKQGLAEQFGLEVEGERIKIQSIRLKAGNPLKLLDKLLQGK